MEMAYNILYSFKLHNTVTIHGPYAMGILFRIDLQENPQLSGW